MTGNPLRSPTADQRFDALVEALSARACSEVEFRRWSRLVEVLSAVLPPAQVARAYRIAGLAA